MSEVFIYTTILTKNKEIFGYTKSVIADSRHEAIGAASEFIVREFPGFSVASYWCEQVGDNVMQSAGWSKDRTK